MTPVKKTSPKPKAEGEAPKKAPAKRKAPAVAKEVKAEVVSEPVVVSQTDVIAETPVLADGKYIFALGRRKTAIAQTKLWTGGKGEMTVNGKPSDEYFTVYEYREALLAPLKAVGQAGALTFS